MVREQVVKEMQPFRRIGYTFVRYGEYGGTALDILTCERIFDEPVNGVLASNYLA